MIEWEQDESGPETEKGDLVWVPREREPRDARRRAGARTIIRFHARPSTEYVGNPMHTTGAKEI